MQGICWPAVMWIWIFFRDTSSDTAAASVVCAHMGNICLVWVSAMHWFVRQAIGRPSQLNLQRVPLVSLRCYLPHICQPWCCCVIGYCMKLAWSTDASHVSLGGYDLLRFVESPTI